MTLEDFEKSLTEDQRRASRDRGVDVDDGRHRKHHHHHHHKRKHEHREKRHGRSDKRAKGLHKPDSVIAEGNTLGSREEIGRLSAGSSEGSNNNVRHSPRLKRDSWMEPSSILDRGSLQRDANQLAPLRKSTSAKSDFELTNDEDELSKHHLEDLAEGSKPSNGVIGASAPQDVEYKFGDKGSTWRMMKLKGVYRKAEETGRAVENVAEDTYGDLRLFDDAREEQIEIDRREIYGLGYVVKEKPSGELFQDRKLESGIIRKASPQFNEDDSISTAFPVELKSKEPNLNRATKSLDGTALNRLRARLMKAKLRKSADAASLEAEYEAALASSTRDEPDVVVLGTMDNRMLAGGREGEVKRINNKRGRERGLVEENEDMSIGDMNDLDYMDDNASKLAKRIHRSEISLKNSAITDLQKMDRILNNCPLCHQEDTCRPPVAPVISLATRTYLTLPTEPEISDGGACVVPIQHRVNLLECDDDEWEEIRNFMKGLTRMYHDQGRDVIFYENAAAPQRKKHAAMEAVPLPYSLGMTAPAFFKEAILTSDEEWTQHKKLIDTLAKANQGLGKAAFRKTLVKEMPYFHVWFQMDGGLGHIVEDADRWPKGDLFAREIIGGMLDKGPEIIKRQGRWSKGVDGRVDGFRKRWRKFDWARLLTDS